MRSSSFSSTLSDPLCAQVKLFGCRSALPTLYALSPACRYSGLSWTIVPVSMLSSSWGTIRLQLEFFPEKLFLSSRKVVFRVSASPPWSINASHQIRVWIVRWEGCSGCPYAPPWPSHRVILPRLFIIPSSTLRVHRSQSRMTLDNNALPLWSMVEWCLVHSSSLLVHPSENQRSFER